MSRLDDFRFTFCVANKQVTPFENAYFAKSVTLMAIILEIIGNIPLQQLNKSHLQKLENTLFARKLKPATVNRYFELLRHALNMAVDEMYITENPVKKYYTPFVEDGTRRALTQKEVQAVLDAARKLQDSPRHNSNIQTMIYDIILFGLLTGARLSEILFLKKSYVQDDMILYPYSQTKSKRRQQNPKHRHKVIMLAMVN